MAVVYLLIWIAFICSYLQQRSASNKSFTYEVQDHAVADYV